MFNNRQSYHPYNHYTPSGLGEVGLSMGYNHVTPSGLGGKMSELEFKE